MLTRMPDSLKSEELYLLIMQYLAVNVGKVVTPSLISKTINNCPHCRNATNKTVSTYLEKIVDQKYTVFCLDRKYVNQDNTSSLEYNRTYYFKDFSLFSKFYESAACDLFSNKQFTKSDYAIACAKMLLYNTLLEEGYELSSGVFVYYSHLDHGKSKKNTFCFDFICKKDALEHYVVFQSGKDFANSGFTAEAKFALQNLLKDKTITIVTTSEKFEIVSNDGFKYVHINDILKSNNFKLQE